MNEGINYQTNIFSKMPEKLCLQWNDFNENITSIFKSLREDKNFAAVTLACEDGKQIEAHKVILVASSPLFKKILIGNKHTHPLIYLRGWKSIDILAIIDFLYFGEVNVHQENLDSFLSIAEELELKGLEGKGNENYESGQNDLPKQERKGKKEVPFDKGGPTFSEPYQTEVAVTEHKTVALPNHFFSDMQELNNKSTSMMEKTSKKSQCGNPLYKCTICGKEDKSYNLKSHIERNHLEGVSIPCNLCGKTFRCTKSLAHHKNRNHA